MLKIEKKTTVHHKMQHTLILLIITNFGIIGFIFRYNYIIKPKREELKKVAEQELLAEGKYVAEKQ